MTNQEVAAEWAEKARHRFRDAELLFEHDSPESAVNRLYYAALAAVTAFLAGDAISVESHRAAIRHVGLHLVKPNRISAEQGRLFKQLQELRDAADYDGLPPIDARELEDLTERTRNFVDAVLGLLDVA